MFKTRKSPSKTNPFVDDEAVRWAYRLILGREPESSTAVQAHRSEAKSLHDLRRQLLGSDEFRASTHGFARPAMSGNEPPLQIDRVEDAQTRKALFDHVAAGWSNYGETDAFWSVVTQEPYRAAQIDAHLQAFYESGRNTVERMAATLKRNDLAWPDAAHCVELGCGTGRLTRWLAPRCARVTALDVSPGHLKLARQHLRDETGNVDWRQLRRIEELAELPRAQIVFTFLVLQHNPPPVIEAMLSGLLQILEPGGIAFVHLPTYIPHYRFSLSEYLDERSDKTDMEMHVLPQRDVFALADRQGMQVLEVLEDATHDLRPGVLSNFFLMRKRPQ